MRRLRDLAIEGFSDLRTGPSSRGHAFPQSLNPSIPQSHNGFTLLEMLVATVIMGIAVVGLLSNLSNSLQHAARLTEYDRATLVARRTMDELLLDSRLPSDSLVEGKFDAAATGLDGGWRARMTAFEQPPEAGPGTAVLDRVELEIWWMSGDHRRRIAMEAFRRSTIPFERREAQ